jgi:hypothetical protein
LYRKKIAVQLTKKQQNLSKMMTTDVFSPEEQFADADDDDVHIPIEKQGSNDANNNRSDDNGTRSDNDNPDCDEDDDDNDEDDDDDEDHEEFYNDDNFKLAAQGVRGPNCQVSHYN